MMTRTQGFILVSFSMNFTYVIFTAFSRSRCESGTNRPKAGCCTLTTTTTLEEQLSDTINRRIRILEKKDDIAHSQCYELLELVTGCHR